MIDAQNLERHELSEAFDVLESDDLSALTESITKHGVITPIVLFEGKVLDGWNRYRIAKLTGAKAKMVELSPDLISPVDYVKANNIARRHMTKSQKAAALVRLSNWRPHGVNTEYADEEEPTATLDDMAEEAGVSKSTIRDAKKAEEGGLGDAVLGGDMSAHDAASQLRAEERDDADEVEEVEVDEPEPADEEPSPEPAPEPEPKMTATDKLRAQNAELVETAASQAAEIDHLQKLVKGYELEVDADAEGITLELRNRTAEVRSLKGSLGTAQTQLRDCQAARKAVTKELNALQRKLADAEDDADD